MESRQSITNPKTNLSNSQEKALIEIEKKLKNNPFIALVELVNIIRHQKSSGNEISLLKRANSLFNKLSQFLGNMRVARSRELFARRNLDDLLDNKKPNDVFKPMIEDANISASVIKSIILSGTIEEAWLYILFFLKVLKICLDEADFNSGMLIMGALNSTAVSRLYKTSPFPNKTTEFLKEANGLFDLQGSYKNLRLAIKKAGKKACPYIGMYLTDLEFSTVGSENKAELQKLHQQWINEIKLLQSQNKKMTEEETSSIHNPWRSISSILQGRIEALKVQYKDIFPLYVKSEKELNQEVVNTFNELIDLDIFKVKLNNYLNILENHSKQENTSAKLKELNQQSITILKTFIEKINIIPTNISIEEFLIYSQILNNIIQESELSIDESEKNAWELINKKINYLTNLKQILDLKKQSPNEQHIQYIEKNEYDISTQLLPSMLTMDEGEKVAFKNKIEKSALEFKQFYKKFKLSGNNTLVKTNLVIRGIFNKKQEEEEDKRLLIRANGTVKKSTINKKALQKSNQGIETTNLVFNKRYSAPTILPSEIENSQEQSSEEDSFELSRNDGYRQRRASS